RSRDQPLPDLVGVEAAQVGGWGGAEVLKPPAELRLALLDDHHPGMRGLHDGVRVAVLGLAMASQHLELLADDRRAAGDVAAIGVPRHQPERAALPRAADQ